MSKPYLLLLLFFLSIQCHFNIAFAQTMHVDVENSNGTYEIKFNSETPLNAAIFLRSNKLWFVFDKVITLSLNEIDYSQADVLKDFKQLKTNNNAAIAYVEINNPENFEITSNKEEENWVIKITPYNNTVLAAEVPLVRNIIKKLDHISNTVNIALNVQQGNIISFIDPFFGDSIITIPEPMIGKNSKYTFVDFSIMESFAGVVINPLNDSLKVSFKDKNAIVSSATYLNISGESSWDNIKSQFFSNEDIILDLKQYKVLPEDFNSNLNKINNEINHSYDDKTKGHNFLNLAMFFLANKWYLEAKTMIEFVYRYSDIIEMDSQVRMAIAAIYLICDEVNAAYDMINSIDLNNVPTQKRSEMRFWINLCEIAYKIENKKAYKSDYLDGTMMRVISKIKKNKRNFLSSYNEEIFNLICFKVLDLGIILDKHNALQDVANALSVRSLPPKDLDLLKYYYGKIFAALGEDKSAITKLSDCASNIVDQYLYSHCRFELTKLMHKASEISQIHYINELQSISTIWRGDNFERNVLSELATTYYNMNDITGAIRVWKLISKSYNQTYDGFVSIARASKAFVDYFNTTNDSSLSKLAFFYEFKDLIPLGDVGDNIILQTTSYMLDLNLLDQVIKVMEYQIKNRLIGFTKEKVINDLVRVYDSMNDWEKAEESIEQFTALPFNHTNPIINERKYLYIKSIIDSGQYMDAIALLYGDSSNKADELRSKAFFNLKNWPEFNDNSEPYLYSIRHNKNQLLTESDNEKLLKQSIAYFSNNQMDLLQNMFLDFKPRFQKNDKNAVRNKIFYQIANELQSPISNAVRNENLKSLIKQLVAIA